MYELWLHCYKWANDGNFGYLMDGHGKEKTEILNLYGKLIVVMNNVEKQEVVWIIVALALLKPCMS